MTSRVRAPELPQDGIWFNTNHPLSMRSLKGRVVILDYLLLTRVIIGLW
ncbi:MAG: hypothetical protein RIB93_17720 [Coleofasciculus sp. D1-CHI-01]